MLRRTQLCSVLNVQPFSVAIFPENVALDWAHTEKTTFYFFVACKLPRVKGIDAAAAAVAAAVADDDADDDADDYIHRNSFLSLLLF
ncbi:hypothetical protein ElyMa_004744400 [Elysia marginata]|uniref:Uncharacterized protein n=1 Tax=Elysia marginata TaxID=1093978 RepID=A0AAV4IFY2_9GAST|nr:hypothetical protein ElyMa_004744400 [Elysia marginata]